MFKKWNYRITVTCLFLLAVNKLNSIQTSLLMQPLDTNIQNGFDISEEQRRRPVLQRRQLLSILMRQAIITSFS